jgi:hypothetical protein
MPDPIKKKIKDNPSGETKWTTKGGITLQLEKQTFGSNLPNLPPVVCSNTSSKSTAMPRLHPMTSFLDVTQ